MTQTKICTTQSDFFSVMHVRSRVFMDEQNVSPLIELDDRDFDAVHIVSYADGKPCASCRILKEDGYAVLGRLAVMPEYRKKGLGSEVLKFAEETAKSLGYSELRLHAQYHARHFYEENGYIPYGETFYEAGILHVSMKKELL